MTIQLEPRGDGAKLVSEIYPLQGVTIQRMLDAGAILWTVVQVADEFNRGVFVGGKVQGAYASLLRKTGRSFSFFHYFWFEMTFFWLIDRRRSHSDIRSFRRSWPECCGAIWRKFVCFPLDRNPVPGAMSIQSEPHGDGARLVSEIYRRP